MSTGGEGGWVGWISGFSGDVASMLEGFVTSLTSCLELPLWREPLELNGQQPHYQLRGLHELSGC